MKKALSLLTALCLLTACCAAGAEGTTSALRYEQNGFTAEIPEGWVFGYSEGPSTFYYAQVEGSENNAMLMIMATREESLIGKEMTDEELQQAYNEMFIQGAVATAIDGNLSGGYAQIAGTLSAIYWLRQTIDDSGTEYSAAYDMAIIDGWAFGMVLLHTDIDPYTLANVLAGIAETVAYDPAAGNAPEKTVSLEDLPKKENPYRFEPTITDRQNYLTAQWMVDESTRALCTMLLTMDLDISITSSFTASYPMNVFASYIGCEEDLIRTIVPSQDETIAYIFEYDTAGKTALYYAEPWSEETLEAFKASCTDQWYANTEEALIYVAQIMMNTFSEGAEAAD